ncbi:MAG: UDP-3-O-(3-hydroxymyristoyl)glucosamine N-acyltransferase [Casimicrobiaceae bacterium]
MPAAPTAGPFTLNELAVHCGARVAGDGSVLIQQVNTLEQAGPGELAFLANPRYRSQVALTGAAAVVLSPEYESLTSAPRLVTDQPYLAYARIASLLNRAAAAHVGITDGARVDRSARIAANASIGPNAVIGAEAVIDDGSVIHAGAVIGARCRIGARAVIHPNVVLYADTQVGADTVIHAGAVLGADGFGMAATGSGWLKIPQIGRVIIGKRVDIGANTTIDRGALDDTVIEDDAKLDNQIQVGHNVRIGARTAIAGCVGIAGSVRIGKDCRIGGAAMISGHIEIGDGVTIAGGTVVAKSLPEPGVYAGVYPLDTMDQWRRTAVRVRRLDQLAARLETLEKRLGATRTGQPGKTENES